MPKITQGSPKVPAPKGWDVRLQIGKLTWETTDTYHVDTESESEALRESLKVFCRRNGLTKPRRIKRT